MRMGFTGDNMTVEEIKLHLSKTLSEKRFNHSLAVADMAKELAKLHGGDEDKAYLAGLAHDCMREISGEDALIFANENGIAFSESEINAPLLWHAMLGAVAIQRLYGITDSDIINAVRYHTTARAGMSLLERIIYVADCTSADRNYSNVEDMRRRARENLDDAVVGSLVFCRDDLSSKGVPVHLDTLAALKEFLS